MLPHTAKVKRYLVITYFAFVGMVVICNVLSPTIRQNNYGISAFGAQSVTLIPYYVGFLILIICLVLISRQLYHNDKKHNLLSVAFLIAAFCLAGIAITSYSQSKVVFNIHLGFFGALAISQLISGAWALKQGLKAFDALLYAIFICMLIFNLTHYSSIPILGLFFVQETIIFICVVALLGRAAFKQLER